MGKISEYLDRTIFKKKRAREQKQRLEKQELKLYVETELAQREELARNKEKELREYFALGDKFNYLDQSFIVISFKSEENPAGNLTGKVKIVAQYKATGGQIGTHYFYHSVLPTLLKENPTRNPPNET